MKYFSSMILAVLLVPITFDGLKLIDTPPVYSTHGAGEMLSTIFVIWVVVIGVFIFGFFTGKEKP